MFSSVSHFFSSIYKAVTGALGTLFSKSSINQEDLEQLRTILLKADVGSSTTQALIEQLTTLARQEKALSGAMVHELLHKQLQKTLNTHTFAGLKPIILLVGVNGSGKTTTVSKLIHYLQKQNKRILIAAADTYRAAATEQLKQWADRAQVPLVTGNVDADPASVVFQALQQFQDQDFDYLIIDTAGRLQTKEHLMKELEKIRRVISKKLPDTQITTLLTLDAMLGQNSFEQARIFHAATQVDGIVLTKMDGTAKGGIVFSVVSQLQIPIAFLTYGEQPDAISLFDAPSFVHSFLDAQ